MNNNTPEKTEVFSVEETKANRAERKAEEKVRKAEEKVRKAKAKADKEKKVTHKDVLRNHLQKNEFLKKHIEVGPLSSNIVKALNYLFENGMSDEFKDNNKFRADFNSIARDISQHSSIAYQPIIYAKAMFLLYSSPVVLKEEFNYDKFGTNFIRSHAFPRAATFILTLVNEVEASSNLISDRTKAILKRAELYELATYIKILYYQRSLDDAALETIYQGLGKPINYLELSKELLKEGLHKLNKEIVDQILDLGINNPVLLVSKLHENFENKEQITVNDIEKFISEHNYLLPIFKRFQTEKQNSSVVSRVSSCSSLYKVPVAREQADASASVSSFRPQ